MSFRLKPGRITALVGRNSSGKSTCVKLLERFYQPQAGDILLDGRPLQDYRDQYLHQKVTQHGTLHNNIVLPRCMMGTGLCEMLPVTFCWENFFPGVRKNRNKSQNQD